MDVISSKSNKTTYTQFINQTRKTHVYHQEFSADLDMAGIQLTDFAVRLLRSELLRYERQRSSLRVEDWGGNNYSVHNSVYNKEYHIVLEAGGGCDCTFSSAFAIACRHVVAIRYYLGQRTGNVVYFHENDYHPR